MSEEFIYANTGVFWDVVDCPIPCGLNPDSIYANIVSGLGFMGYHGRLSSTFWAYSKKVSEDVFFDYKEVGITIQRVKGDQSARVDMMTKDILFFALDNPKKPTNLMLIANNMSQKPELIRVLQVLKSRNINVVVAQPDALVPIELYGIVSCVCLSKNLLDGGKATMLELDPEIKNVRNLSFFQQVSKKPSYESTGNTGVFWDTNNCPNPNALELDFYLIGKNIKSGLATIDKSGSRVSSISAYEDGGKITVWNGGTDTKMVLHQGDRLKRMLLDILLWAIDNRVGQYRIDRRPNVMVITRNIPKTSDFINTLKYLSSRDCKIIFGVPDELKSVSSWKTVSVINFGEPFFSSGSPQRRQRRGRQKAVSGPKSCGVFWDVLDCPIPCGLELDPDLIYENIKSGIGGMGFHGDLLTIRAYAGKVPLTMFNDYNKVGITIEEVTGDQSVRISAMVDDIVYFAHGEGNRPRLIVIAKDILEDSGFIRFCHLKIGVSRILVGTQSDALQELEHQTGLAVCSSKSLLEGQIAILSDLDPVNNSVEALSEELAHIDIGIVPELDNSVEAALSKEIAYANIGVYWDIVDCPIPKGLNPKSIYANIISGLANMGYHGKVTERWAYARKISLDVFNVGIFMQAGPDESARVYMMARAMLLFALDNPHKPSNLMVIANNVSKKPELIRVLQVLKRRNINVVLAQPDTLVAVELRGIASSVCLSTSLLARGKATLLELNPEMKNVVNLDYLHNSAVSEEPTDGNTGVFWDTKDSPNPNTTLELDFGSIVYGIKLCLATMDKSDSLMTSILAYDDGGNIRVWNRGTDTGMVLHQGDRLKRMSLDILLWALDNRVGQYPNGHRRPNVIVVSKNLSEDFVKTMKYLSTRHCNVIYGVPDEVKVVSLL